MTVKQHKNKSKINLQEAVDEHIYHRKSSKIFKSPIQIKYPSSEKPHGANHYRNRRCENPEITDGIPESQGDSQIKISLIPLLHARREIVLDRMEK